MSSKLTPTALPTPPREYDIGYMDRLVKQIALEFTKSRAVTPITCGSDLSGEAGFLISGLTIVNPPVSSTGSPPDGFPEGSVWCDTTSENSLKIITSGPYTDQDSLNLANTTDPALGDALIGFRQSNASGILTGAVGRTVHDKLQETVSVKDFGAVGDGVTDDTAAFTNALAAAATLGRRVSCNGFGTTYVVGNVTLSASILDAKGSLFVPPAGANYCFKVTGDRPQILDMRISDPDSNVVRSTTLASSVVTNATSFVLSSAAGLVVGQAVWMLADDGMPFMSRIKTIVSNTITTEAGIHGAVTSGRIVRASFGQIYVNASTFFNLENVQIIGGSAGIWVDGNDGDTGKGSITGLRGYTYKHFGIAMARGVHEVTVENYFLRGGFTSTTNATGNSVTTAFSIPEEARMKRDLYVTVNGVPQTYTTNYTITENGPSGATVTFVSPPASGAVIVFTNYAMSEFGVWTDGTGWSSIRGGSRFGKGVTIQHRVGRFIRERELEEHNNNQDDTCAYRATWIKECERGIWLDNHYAGYAYEPIVAEDSIGVTIGGRLETWITPSAEWSTVVAQLYAILGIGATTRVQVNPYGWTVSSDKGILGAGSTVYTTVPTDKITAGTGSFPFSNSWTNEAAPFGPLIAAKGVDNIVTLDGAIKTGTPGYLNVLATLPVGYRPGRNLVFPVSANGAVAFVGVKTDGTIIQEWGPALSATITSFGGISFEVA